jgi:hypothetical protein
MTTYFPFFGFHLTDLTSSSNESGGKRRRRELFFKPKGSECTTRRKVTGKRE